MISPVTLLLLLLAAFTFAAPAPQPQSDDIVSRRNIVDKAKVEDVVCTADGKDHKLRTSILKFAVARLEKAFDLPDEKKPSSGTVPYPHEYKTDEATRSPKVHSALNKIGNCMTAVGKTYFEFPVVASIMSKPYLGGDPGPFRVIVVYDGDETHGFSNPQYCMTVAHESRESKHMIPCV